MALAMATTIHRYQFAPFSMSSSSSSTPRYQFAPFSMSSSSSSTPSIFSKLRARARIGRTLIPPPPITTCGLPLEEEEEEEMKPSMKSRMDLSGAHFSASQGRRGFALVTAFSFMLPLHWPAEMVAAGEISVIQNGVRSVLSKAKSAGVLRMVFHDAGTFDMDDNSGGMNGSIVYELDRPENAGLSKTLKILEKAKKEIDKIQQVSWADLIAVAGAEAVALCGGPNIPVQLGRLDASIPDPEGKLPPESLDASGLKRVFRNKGFSTQELVALSGAHTLGSKGFGNPNVFDNAYFKILLEKPWTSSGSMSAMIGLPSDRALMDDDECLRWIETYAGDEVQFFDDFRNAYCKLVNSGAIWAST